MLRMRIKIMSEYFQISMNDALRMAEIDGTNDLSKYSLRISFLEFPMFRNVFFKQEKRKGLLRHKIVSRLAMLHAKDSIDWSSSIHFSSQQVLGYSSQPLIVLPFSQLIFLNHLMQANFLDQDFHRSKPFRYGEKSLIQSKRVDVI